MAIPSIVLGLCLIALGFVGYFATGRISITALIPIPFGLVFILLGAMARNARMRMHAMHAAALLALLAILFTAKGIILVARMWGGATIEKPEAAVAKATMAMLCLVFLIFCVNSFVQVRRARRAGGA